MHLYFITMDKAKEDKFNQFWNSYPRKVKKFVARRTWGRLTNKEIEEISKVLKDHIVRWEETEIQYVPHASTWLNQKRWEDELEPLPKKEISSDEFYDKQAKDFQKMIKEAEENMATDEEIKEALGIK